MLRKSIYSLTLYILATVAVSSSEVIHCTGKGVYFSDRVAVSISLPSKMGEGLWVIDQQDAGNPKLINPHVGAGRIVMALMDEQKQFRTATHEHPFVVTQIPRDDKAIAGLFFDGNSETAWIVKADLWNPSRTFWMAGNGRQYLGSCQ